LKREIKGGILIAVAAFFWGISGTVAKMVFNNSINPIKLVNMRMNLSFLILFTYFYFMNKSVIKIKKKDIKYFAIIGIFGMVGLQSSYYYTVSKLNVSVAIFLQFLSPIFIALYCVAFEKEKLTASKLSALAFAMAGSVFIIFGKGSTGVVLSIVGLASGFASALFNAFYCIYGNKCTARYNSWTVLLYGLGFGALFFWLVSPPWVVWRGADIYELGTVLYFSIFATIIPYGLYLWGLRFIAPTPGSIIAMLEPVVASLSAFLILGELMTIVQMLGGLLVIVAVIVIQSYNDGRKEENNEAAM
jgi:drug/metabolite transporter (DMT)-like permease